jgi:nicotinamidase-related amidase
MCKSSTGVGAKSHKTFKEKEMRRSPLVIIDVQKDYSVKPAMVTRLVKHVRAARKSQVPVLIVELSGQGPTDPTVMQELAGYDKVKVVQKRDCDGSREVVSALGPNGHKRLRLCGLFTDDCVDKTAKGLYRKGFDIEIVEEACFSYRDCHKRQVALWEKKKEFKVMYKGKDWRPE